ncbi:MAG: U32 family peptidase [Anaeroplasmataceae bacterium]|nr:U32 family peptidase [Anaeroplasmataceae bacterium]
MSELLAPAGNFEALVAAISNGADAIYLGMNQFGARAYSANFDQEGFKEAISYAHLRNVKIYVTLNTIIFEDELPAVYQMIDFLNANGVDGIIIQDLAVFDYIVKKYPNIEAHCSTQMGIDDVEGTLLFKKLGAKRVVLSREVEIEEAKKIKKIAKIPLEIFIHGALCVSYSGNCLMSGLIGYRSGNRGRCVGSCRKAYTLVDETTNQVYPSSYLLSMKDLNTLSHIDELKEMDSLKIEGRMKEPSYVANVVSAYRRALDGASHPEDKMNLSKTFHRTFTKGYLFHEDKKDITNISRPNNFGIPIGKIIDKNSIGYKLELTSPLYQNDIIRIDHNNEDINLTVVKLYDEHKNYISSANKFCYIQVKEDLSNGDIVYKTKEYSFYQELSKSYPKEFRRFKIDFIVSAFAGTPLTIHAVCETHQVSYESDTILDSAKTQPTSREAVLEQLNRLKESVYSLGTLEYYADSVYIPAKLLNEARRYIVSKLNVLRIERNYQALELPLQQKLSYPYTDSTLAVYVTTEEQYEAAKECGISIIYTKDNTIRRNAATYPKKDGMVLVGGYGGIANYTKTNETISDFSLNVVNSKAVYQLHKLGVKRVTLSYELNKNQIQGLIEGYEKENGGLPNLEMIVYGHTHLLFTKYCPLKKMNLCGTCKKHRFSLKDEYGTFPILTHPDCTTTILNGKILNLIDELDSIKNISVFRLQFTIESKEETKKVIQQFQEKLSTKQKTKLFNSSTDTRGHFNKEIL